MKIYLVRHGETNYNLKNLCNAEPGEHVFLTKLGKEQAKKAREKLKHVNFDKVYVSDLYRTQQTAKIIAPESNFIIDRRLTDVKTGYEDKSAEFFHNAISSDRFNIIPEGGESFQDVKKRVHSFINDLEGENILIVSHHNPIIAMRSFFFNLSDQESYDLDIKNCEIIEIDKK